jgi:hypothetical protein
MPEVEAWRRKAGRDKRWRKAVAVLITAPFVVSGVMTLAVALAVANPVAAGVGLLLTVFGTLLIAYELHQARWEREVRMVLRFDRPRAVPTRAHYFGSALAASWSETVARAEACEVTNPEVFLAIASDSDRWFPVHEGLAVFGPLTDAWLPGTRERADLARIVAMLASAPPSAGNDAPSPASRTDAFAENDAPSPASRTDAFAENDAPSPASRTDAFAENDAPSPASRTDASTEPLRFRLEYVDGRDPRTSNELFASGYCVALAGERGT